MQACFDYNADGFVKILIIDSSFLIEYIEDLFSRSGTGTRIHNIDKQFSAIWQIKNIENVIIKALDFLRKKHTYLGLSEQVCTSFFANLSEPYGQRADNFLLNYLKVNIKKHDDINIVLDIIKHTRRQLLEGAVLLIVSLNQGVEHFSKIAWINTSGTYSGDVNFGDIRAAEWNSILTIVNKSDIGMELIPIKQFLNDRINYCIEDAKIERQGRFFIKNN